MSRTELNSTNEESFHDVRKELVVLGRACCFSTLITENVSVSDYFHVELGPSKVKYTFLEPGGQRMVASKIPLDDRAQEAVDVFKLALADIFGEKVLRTDGIYEALKVKNKIRVYGSKTSIQLIAE